MDLFFGTSEFSPTGIKLLDLVLKILNFDMVKLLVVVQHLNFSFAVGICRVG